VRAVLSSFAHSIDLRIAGPASIPQAEVPFTPDFSVATNGPLTVWAFGNRRTAAEPSGQTVAQQVLRHALPLGHPDATHLKNLDGPFAIVLVNNSTSEAYLAADRIGQVPLYFALRGHTITFAPRLRNLETALQGRPEVRRQSVFDYVYFHCIPSPQTIYEDVYKVERATLVKVSASGISSSRYWKPAFAHPSAAPSMTDTEIELLSTLGSSVQRACHDPALGAFLSGGLDSSTVVGLLAGNSKHTPFRAVSMGFSAEGYDEIPFARIAAKHFGAPHLVHYVTAADIARYVRDVAGGFDEPFGNSSALPTFVCASVAQEAGISQLLAGDGGDELFGGNDRYQHQLRFEAFNAAPAIARRLIAGAIGSWPPPFDLSVTRKGRSFLEQCAIPLPDRLQRYNFLHQIPPNDVFEDTFLQHADPAAPMAQLRGAYNEPDGADPLDRMLYLDWKFTLQDNDLVKVNTACRLAGIRVDYPILSNEVIDLSCRLPPNWKTRRGELRWFYKRAMRRLLPPAIIDKVKHGFGLPFGVWLRDDDALRAIADEGIDSLRNRGWFRTDFLDRVITMHRAGHASYYGELVWLLMMLGLWVRANVDRGSR
jgi:asparagine synthase (glutamine-hydrolysing)